MTIKKHQYIKSLALYSTKQIKDIEQRYAEQSTDGTYSLMEKAGATAFHHIQTKWPHARKILIMAGKGNNAGDGFVVARLAAEQRLKVHLCCLNDPAQLSGDALTAYKNMPHQVIHNFAVGNIQFSDYDVIVDAMLGTGIKGRLTTPYALAIKGVNAVNVPVLSIDIPSGVEADTGFVSSDAVKSDLTITFVGHKKGMYTGDAANYCGRVYLSELDIPSQYYERHTFHLFSQNWRSLKGKLKPRDSSCHKGMFGHTLVIGGLTGMSGAAILASTAAARSGSGLTSAWVSEQCATSLINHTPEIMARGVKQGNISDQFLDLPTSYNSFVIGPGLGKSEWSECWVTAVSEHEIIRESKQVWDADALNLLAAFSKESINRHNSNRILTPHPGEAARLLNTSTYTINQDRYNAAQMIAEQYGGVCVLKGNGTVIADEHGFQVVCPVGNPGMASGGMGDVLAGLIGGLLAQGYSSMDAAMLGVCIHGEAADLAAGSHQHYRGLLASDLIAHFPALLNP